jgi:hypothetical protein
MYSLFLRERSTFYPVEYLFVSSDFQNKRWFLPFLMQVYFLSCGDETEFLINI